MKAVRKPRAFNSMPKGAACVSCRTRKVRCTGELPACAACMRTAKYRKREPTCAYENDKGAAGRGAQSTSKRSVHGMNGMGMQSGAGEEDSGMESTKRNVSRVAKSVHLVETDRSVSDNEIDPPYQPRQIEYEPPYQPHPLDAAPLLASQHFPPFADLPYPHNPDYTPSYNPSLPLGQHPSLYPSDLVVAPFGGYTFPALPLSPHLPTGLATMPTSPSSFGDRFDDTGTIVTRRGRGGMRLDMPEREFPAKGVAASEAVDSRSEQTTSEWRQEIFGIQQAQEALRKMMSLPYVPPATLPDFKGTPSASTSTALSNFQFRSQIASVDSPSRLAPLTPLSTSQQSRPPSSQAVFRPRLPSISDSLSGYIYPPPIASPSVDMLLSLGQNSPWESRATEW